MPIRSRILHLPDGRQLGLAEYGDPAGIPVLALHGAPDCRLMFAVADEPARTLGLRLICPDRPGYGLSTLDTRPTLAARAESLHRIADHLGLGRFAILGVSGGGPYAVALAARLGTCCTALALVSPIGPVADAIAAGGAPGRAIAPGFRRFFIGLQRWPRLLAAASRLAAAAFRLSPDLWMRSAGLGLPAPDRAILKRPEVRRLLITSMQEALRQGVAGGLADLAIYSRPWGVDYERLVAPVLVWQGLEDRIVPPPATFYLASMIPCTSVHRIDGAGHFWVLEHIEDVLAELAGVLERKEQATCDRDPRPDQPKSRMM